MLQELFGNIFLGTHTAQTVPFLQRYLLNKFNKTPEIFSCVIRVLSILLTTATASASVERVNSKERVPNVPCSILAASYAEM